MDEQRGLLRQAGQGIANFTSGAGLAMNFAAPWVTPPPCVDLNPTSEPSAIMQEVDPADCPSLVDSGELRLKDAVLDWGDHAERRLKEKAAETSEALEAATVFEGAMDAVPALDIPPPPEFLDGGGEAGGPPMA